MTRNSSRITIIALIAWLWVLPCHAQQDSVCKLNVPLPPPHHSWFGNLYRQAWGSLQKTPVDNVDAAGVLHAKSEDAFKPFEGKHIRKIFVDNIDFERSFIDTTSRMKNIVTTLANHLHTDTRSWVIRQNLFIHRGDLVNPYKMADNERYLRSLSYLQEARITAQLSCESDDSVDVYVITKDVFSLKGDVDISGVQSIRMRLGDDNLLGTAQQVRLTLYGDQGRYPHWGNELLYSNNNMRGTFSTLVLMHTTINTGASEGGEDEDASVLRLIRPLISPYSHLAGGMEISDNKSHNYSRIPDSSFYHYRYNIYDGWLGYNLGIKRLLQHDSGSRDRKFVSARYLLRRYSEVPYQINEAYSPIYNNRQAVLGQMTFFRQDFVKTQYIYGFGITEDVPYGYNVSVTGGWWEQLTRSRPYAGTEAAYYTANKNGSFAQYYVRAGSFLYQGRMEDVSLMAGINYFSKIMKVGRWKMRQTISASYSALINPVISEPLRIDNDNGLRWYNTDSAAGGRRMVLQEETVLFLNRKLLGFQFAPFTSVGEAWLSPNVSDPLSENRLYATLGGGIRARNENLVFNTLELRFAWFPTTIQNLHPFRIELNSNIRYRYNTNYVHAPDIIRLNNALQ